MADIDDEKRASQALEEKASRDELTGLYNRKTARKEIDTIWKEEIQKKWQP